MVVVAKPVTCTLDPNRPRKPEVDIMIYSVLSKSPKGMLQCHKNSYLIPWLTMRFSTETVLGGHPPRCRDKG